MNWVDVNLGLLLAESLKLFERLNENFHMNFLQGNHMHAYWMP